MALGVSAQEPALDDVLSRAAAYVGDFERQVSGVVAEEAYTQDVAPASGMTALRGVGHRELKSDLLLVRPQGAERWIQFRDVFEVDGRPVRDRSERLVKLFLEPDASTASQVQRIIADSTRYNIGDIQRTINVPLFALLILERQRQPHFRFDRTASATPPLVRDADVPAGTWVVRYAEQDPQTLISTTNGRDLPSHGRFWIDPATGRVLMSELVAADPIIAGTIVVRYRPDAATGLLLPETMRERYELRGRSRIDGRATYGRFRQFQVKVDENIAPIKK